MINPGVGRPVKCSISSHQQGEIQGLDIAVKYISLVHCICGLAICEMSIKDAYTYLGISDNAAMRTLSNIFIIYPSFDDRFQLCSEVRDMEQFFSNDSRLSMNRVGAIPPEAI